MMSDFPFGECWGLSLVSVVISLLSFSLIVSFFVNNSAVEAAVGKMRDDEVADTNLFCATDGSAARSGVAET